MADPTYNTGSVDFDMEDDTGYSLVDAELNDECWQNYRGFILAQSGTPAGDECDDSDFSNWYDYSTLTPELSIVAFGDQSGKAESSSNDWSTNAFWGGIGTSSVHEVWFYDDGSTITAYERAVLFILGSAAPAFVPRAGIGLDFDESGTNYLWWNIYKSGGSGWEDTGTVRSVGWHSVRYRYHRWITGVFPTTVTHWRVKMYLDGQRLINEEEDSDTGSDPGYGRAKTFGVRTQESGKPLYIDRIRGRKAGTLYEESGTVETPKAQPPTGVDSWSSISETEDISVHWKGSTTYEFQWSTDGGSSWNGSWIDASDSNLAGISCDGDGQDAIKFRITLTGHEDRLHSPRARGLTLSYTPAVQSIAMDALALTGAPKDVSLILGAVSQSLDALGLTGTPQDATLVPGEATMPLDTLALAAVCKDLSLGLGAVQTLLNRLELVSTVKDLSVNIEQVIELAALSLSCVPHGLLQRLGVLVLDDGRGIQIEQEDRLVTIDTEARTIAVTTEDRTIIVAAEDRHPTVPAEDRTIEVE